MLGYPRPIGLLLMSSRWLMPCATTRRCDRWRGAIVDNAMSPLTGDFAEVIEPLGDDEERRAVEAALARLDLRRPMIYGVELRIEKRRGGRPGRQIGVVLADLDAYLVYEVTLGDDGAVIAVDARPNLVPPFSEEEVAEAAVLARTDPRLLDLARRWGVRYGTFYPSQHGHDHDEQAPEPGRRHVGLHFVDASDPVDVVPLASAVVDLTNRVVTSVELH
jgi:hypothetical protein